MLQFFNLFVLMALPVQDAQAMPSRHKPMAYSFKVDETPRYVTVSRRTGQLVSYLPFPDQGSAAKYNEGYQIEFVTSADRRFRIPGRAKLEFLMSHDADAGPCESDFIQCVLPEGHEPIRGYKLFAPNGKLLGEQYYNPREPLPDIGVEVSESGDLKLTPQGRFNYWNMRISYDRGISWSKPAFPAEGRWNQALEDSKDWQKTGVMVELTILRNFKVEKRRFMLTSPGRGTLSSMGYISE